MAVSFKGLCFDPSVNQPVGCDYKPKSRLHELVISGTLNINYHDHQTFPYKILFPWLTNINH